jgi:hypothetical protein
VPNLENKERLLEAARGKCHLTYKGKHIRITLDFSAQTLKSRIACSNII